MRSFIVTLAAAAGLGLDGAASAAPIDWSDGFLLQGRGGVVSPLVLVGFDPQPDPPGDPVTRLDATSPVQPQLVIPNQSNPPGGVQLFDLFLALEVAGVDLTIVPSVFPSDTVPTLELEVRQASRTGPLLFDVFFDFATSSGGLVEPGSVVGFDPQPDPPGQFGATFGLTLGFSRLSEVTVAMRTVDAQGNRLSLATVPEPSSALGFAFGLAACARARRWR
jgi:hypothetical protein